MITSDDYFVLTEGSQVAFSRDCVVYMQYKTGNNQSYLDVEIKAHTGASEGQVGGALIYVEASDLSGRSTTVASTTLAGDDAATAMNEIVEKEVKAYLEGLTENSGVTFTIV